MATKNELRKGVEIAFADGKTRTIYPVSLRVLRGLMKVMKELEDMGKVTIDDDGTEHVPDQMADENIDKMVEAAQIILRTVEPEIAENLDDVEELVDIRNFNVMVAAAMGTDPNA